MAFLSPLFLLGALAAAVPIVLHLLKREPETRVRFSAVHLLRHAPVEQLEPSPAARTAAARAARGGAAAAGVRVRASLPRLEPRHLGRHHRRRARHVAEHVGAGAVREGAPAGEAGDRPSRRGTSRRGRDLRRWRAGCEPAVGDRATATAAIDAAQPGAGGTRFRAALNASVDLLRGRPGTIVVVTDLQETGWDVGDRASVPDSVKVEVADVGAPPANLAVTSARVAGDRVCSRRCATPGPTPGVGAPAPERARLARLDVQPRSVAAEIDRAGWRGTDGQRRVPAPERALGVGERRRRDGRRRATTPASWCSTARRGRRCSWSRTSGDLARDAFYLQQALDGRGRGRPRVSQSTGIARRRTGVVGPGAARRAHGHRAACRRGRSSTMAVNC